MASRKMNVLVYSGILTLHTSEYITEHTKQEMEVQLNLFVTVYILSDACSHQTMPSSP